MQSIRRSLVVYFLALMAVALGALAFLVDRVAGRTLAARESAVAQLIDHRYAELATEERTKLDEALTAMASRLANDVQMQYYQKGQKEFTEYWQHMRYAPLMSLSVGLAPMPVAVPMWAQVGDFRSRNPAVARLNEAIARSFFSKLHLDDLPSLDFHGNDYVHVTVQAIPNRVYRSATLEGERWDAAIPTFDANKLIEERFETRTLRDGTQLRLVALKTPISVVLRVPGQRGPFIPSGPRLGPRSGSDSGPRSMQPPQPEPPPQVPFRTAYIQCGRPIAPLEAKLAMLDAQRDLEKAEESTRTQSDLRRLRTWLGLIGALTFAGLIGGGLLLVKRGLRPLDTLSEAVGKVSQKDFRLPVERSQLSQELLPIHDRLTETLGLLKSAFEHDKQAVADISHELRTPVAALLATLDVALRKPRDAEQYKQTLVECRTIARQLQGLVERVMLLASLDASPPAVASEVDVVGLAEECAAVIRPLAEAHGMTLDVSAPEPVTLHTDGEKLREVILNLLHNAVEYNTPGGRVELNVRNGKSVRMSVRDTGIGMSDEVKSRIFERFYRADPSRTQTGIHAGLGLAIVKECVDRLGGRIEVKSAPGQGSEFTVELPV